MNSSFSCPCQSMFEEVPSWDLISETLEGALDFLKHHLNAHSSRECFAHWKRGFVYQKLEKEKKMTTKIKGRSKCQSNIVPHLQHNNKKGIGKNIIGCQKHSI